MSFHERSTALMVVLMAGVYGWYFADILGAATRMPVSEIAYQKRFWVMVGLLIGLSIIGHILIAILGGGEESDARDERDRLIEWKSEARAGWALGLSVLGSMALAMKGGEAFWIAHLLLGGLVLGEIGKGVLKLVYYRTGV